MSSFIDSIFESFLCEGILKTARRAVRYPFGVIKRRRLSQKLLSMKLPQDRFTWIYNNNYWGSGESVSGPGSTLKYTERLRNDLPKLLLRLSIGSIFDAPCGDFGWMRCLLATVNVKYIGGDIVELLIESHNGKYKTSNVSFVHIDLTKDTFPKSELMICRDCLFHLSYDDTRLVLCNFVNSGIPYLLTTTYRNDDKFCNKDIVTGGFRFIDLVSAPYHFPANPLATIPDWVDPDPERYMCLWSREQVRSALVEFDRELGKVSSIS